MIDTDLAEVAAMEKENLSPWSVASLERELATRQARQYVAEGPNAYIVGWCACRMIWPEAELLKIAVRQQYRKGGIGALLLQHLCDTLYKKKVSSLFLEVRTNDRVASNFYKKQGFLHVGSRPGYYTDPPDSALILKKDLSS